MHWSDRDAWHRRDRQCQVVIHLQHPIRTVYSYNCPAYGSVKLSLDIRWLGIWISDDGNRWRIRISDDGNRPKHRWVRRVVLGVCPRRRECVDESIVRG